MVLNIIIKYVNWCRINDICRSFEKATDMDRAYTA